MTIAARDDTLFDLLPAAACLYDAPDGRLRRYNARAAAVWGRSPKCGSPEERFDGAFRLLCPDGSPLPHEDSPAAQVLRTGEGVSDFELLVERPDGARVAVRVTADPVYDQDRLTGVISVYHAAPVPRVDAADREARYRAFFEATLDGIMLVDDAGRYVEVNESMARLLRTTRQELVGASFQRYIPPDLLVSATEALGELKTFGEFEGEFPLQAADGSVVELEWTSRSNIVPGLHVCVAREISQRKRAEAALRESEARYRTVVEHAADGIWMTRRDGTILDANQSASRMLGYTREELLALRVPDLCHPDDLEARSEQLAFQQPGLSFRQERRMRRKDGTYVVVEGAGLLLEGGEFLTITRDVTARREAELELERSRQLFRHIAEATPDLLFVFDLLDDRCVFVNHEVQRILGFAPEQIVALGTSVLQSQLHPEDLGHVRAQHARLSRMQDGEILEYEYRSRHVGGGYRWFRSRATVFARTTEGAPRQILGIAQDITEQRRAMEALRESEQRFAGIVNHSPAMIFVKDGDGRYSTVNTGFAQAAGRPVDEIRGKTDFDLYDPETAARFRADDARVLASGQPLTYEESFEYHGRHYTFITTKFPLLGVDGQSSAVCGIATDISDRKAAEEALRASERQFRQLADAMPQMVWTARPDGSLDYCNQRWLEYTGLSVDESLGAGWLAALYPEDRNRVASVWDEVLRSGDLYDVECRFVRAFDGQARWHIGRAVPLHDSGGKVLRWIGTCTDIHDQKVAEETRRQADEFRQAVEASMQAGVAVIDLEGRQTYVNPAFARLVGWSEEELAGAVTPYAYWPPEELEAISSAFQQTLAGNVPPTGFELKLCRRDGSRFDARVMPSPLRDAAGEVVGWLAAVYDISDHKRLEADLRAQAEALQLADRRKDEFLAMLAHELRNPLSPILNAVQVLNVRGPDEPVQQRQRDVIQRQARHLARLLDDLLDVARITRGKIELQLEVLDLRQVVDHAVESCRPALEQRGHAIYVHVPDAPVYLEADATRLHQVIGNLLSNAAKYTPAGGEISLAVIAGDGEAVLSIRDTGVGISPDLLRHVFELFAQGDRSLARSEGGLGIGLTMVERLVKMHGGRVTAESDGPGAGSTFTVRLPALAQPAETQPGTVTQPAAAVAPAAPRILVIDDNADAADTLQELLQLWGYEVRAANSGPEGLSAAAEFQPDVVLLDIGLPGMDGYEVAERLPGATSRRTVVVALTGYGQDHDRLRARDAGFDHHLVKPVDLEALHRLLADSTVPAR